MAHPVVLQTGGSTYGTAAFCTATKDENALTENSLQYTTIDGRNDTPRFAR